MEILRLGTIGSGFIVHNILKNVVLTPGIRLEAVYSRSREKGQALADQYGASRVYTRLEDLLGDPEVDILYIASPNSLHYPQASAALEAGKHVILEKPFAPTAAMARELVDLAREKGLYLVEAVPTVFLPNLAPLREHLPEIGRVRLVMGNFSQYSSRYDQLLRGQVTNVFDPSFAGGALMDINFYNIHLTQTLFGPPRQVRYDANLWPGLVDTSGVVTLTYADFLCQLTGAKDTWGVNYYQIEGEQGYIYVQDGAGCLTSIRVVTRQGEQVYNLQESPDRWGYEVRALTQALLEGRKLDPLWDTTLAVAQTLERARKSAGIRFGMD